MSEYLLESGSGGSIANVAYSPCGVSSTSQLLYKEFLNNLFEQNEHCLGRAVFTARCSVIARYPDDDSIYGPAVLWTLLGDPALRIKHYIASGIEEDLGPDAHSRLTAPHSLLVCPNPCNASTTIRSSTPLTAPRSLCVYDASGRLVYSQQFRASSFPFSTSSLPAGVYVLRSVSGSHCFSVPLLVRH
jgi:hypothetical protein